MGSTFGGLEIAKTGLFVSQKALDLVGHNIANINTPGYTRQRLITTSLEASGVSMRLNQINVGQVGRGVGVLELDQVRSKFLDAQFRQENTMLGTWSHRSQGLTYLEGLFDEHSDSSLTTAISDFFNSVHELSMNSSDKELCANVRQQAIKMADNFKYISTRLVDQHNNQNTAVETVANRINSIAKSIGELNVSIYRYELSGENANDLMDQRNLLLDELSGYTDITYSTDSDGKLTVRIAGEDLVNHGTVNNIAFSYTANPYTGVNDKVNLTLGATALNTTTMKGGELYAHLNLRDSNSSGNPGIPYFIERLDALAQSVVTEVNAVHASGFTYPNNENGNVSQDGINFFAPFTNARNMSLSAEVLNSVYNIATSSVQIDLTSPDTQTGNQLTASTMAELINTKDFFSTLNSIVLDLAVTLQHSKSMAGTQQTMASSVDNLRTSMSGVSMDEELTDLIRFQHAYSGAARVITAMDESIDLLINRMGIVGRG